jgi:hypothetical protein
MRKKAFGCLGFLLILVIVFGFWAVENILPYSVIRPWKHAATRQPTVDFEEISFEGAEKTAIRGWLVPAKTDTVSQNTLIFCHGIGGNRGHFVKTADKMAALGWNCLLLDGRSMGESEGDFCTFGFYEKIDLKNAVDFLEKRFPNGKKQAIWGASLGGAVALQALEYDERLDFGVVESTFCDLPTIVSDYQGRRFFGIKMPGITAKALKKAGEIAHFDPFSISPEHSAKNIEQPVLLVHGDRDDRISPDYGRRIFANLAAPKKEFFIVNGAHHLNVHAVGGENLEQKFLDFFEKNKN